MLHFVWTRNRYGSLDGPCCWVNETKTLTLNDDGKFEYSHRTKHELDFDDETFEGSGTWTRCEAEEFDYFGTSRYLAPPPARSLSFISASSCAPAPENKLSRVGRGLILR